MAAIRSHIRPIIFLAMVLLLPVLAAFAPSKGKPSKGVYYEDAALVDAIKGKMCRPDSGAGTVIYFSKIQENPLFASKSPNTVHLYIWAKSGITLGQTYTLPHADLDVCYFEKGDLLMFHTFEATGSLQIDPKSKAGQITGKMDLKLVKPHHNMSNSDYHYMGGPFVLKQAKLQAQ